MTRHKSRKAAGLCIGFFLLLMIMGCGTAKDADYFGQETGQDADTGYILAGPGSYDSADTAVVLRVNSAEGTITFWNLAVNKSYTLNYDGATSFSDRYGQPMTLSQIREGDIVDVTFLKSKKRLTTLALSAESFTSREVNRYAIDSARHTVTIGNDAYKLTEDTRIFSDGGEIELMDLNSADILTFQGIDTTVYSIIVEKGHGYLRLSGDEKFIGGWIEVGQNIIHPITEDMLLTVPEGSYQVLVSVKGGGGAKNVVINRNQEVSLDISDLEVAQPRYGQVVFAMTPSTASLYVDGALVDTSAPVTLEYGIHQLLAKAAGYSSVTSYLKVAEESAGIEIVLEAESGDTEDTTESSQSATVSSGNSDTATSYYKIYVDAPAEAEVYVDGNYVGIAPVSFKKEAGTHVVTLRRTGYTPRSYTIQVDSEAKDVTYSFAELVAE